jgi:hypothetical protein
LNLPAIHPQYLFPTCGSDVGMGMTAVGVDAIEIPSLRLSPELLLRQSTGVFSNLCWRVSAIGVRSDYQVALESKLPTLFDELLYLFFR